MDSIRNIISKLIPLMATGCRTTEWRWTCSSFYLNPAFAALIVFPSVFSEKTPLMTARCRTGNTTGLSWYICCNPAFTAKEDFLADGSKFCPYMETGSIAICWNRGMISNRIDSTFTAKISCILSKDNSYTRNHRTKNQYNFFHFKYPTVSFL